MEKRIFERIPANLHARFSYDSTSYTGTVMNLSESGMFISTNIDFPFKTSFELLIFLKDKFLKVPVKTIRLVKSNSNYDAIAVEILNPQKDYLELVNNLRSDFKSNFSFRINSYYDQFKSCLLKYNGNKGGCLKKLKSGFTPMFRYIAAITVVWSLTILGFLIWNIHGEHLQAIHQHLITITYLSHGLIWVLGLAGIGFGSQKIQRNISKRNEAKKALWKAYDELDDKVKERTNQLSEINDKLKTEIADRKKAEEVLIAVNRISRLIGVLTVDEIIQVGLEDAVWFSGSKIGYVHFTNYDQKTVARSIWTHKTLDRCKVGEMKSHARIEEAGIWTDCIHQMKPVIHNDYDGMPNKNGLPAGHVPLIRDMAIPVFENDKIIAVLGVGNKEENYSQSDITQLTFFTESIWSIVQRKRAEESLNLLSNQDGLTGLANRRHFDAVMEKEWKRAVRNSTSLSFIMMDIDYFKNYNDMYGHQAGDECLKVLAECLRNVIKRPADLVARYGGEEFIVLLPKTEMDGAIRVAESMCRSVRNMNIPHEDAGTGLHITISTGVASIVPDSNMSPPALLRRADEALYRAKRQGRNRVIGARN